jgi:heme-degrading monooxygenase HmoA
MSISKNQLDNRWPDRYFVAIFTSQRSQSGEDVYEIMASRMVALAQQQRGFLGVESVRSNDGIGITVSYWTDREAIQNWGRQAEHVSVQAMGRQEFYHWYRIRIAEVFTDRTFMSDDAVLEDSVA